jgi:hypothetical protein
MKAASEVSRFPSQKYTEPGELDGRKVYSYWKKWIMCNGKWYMYRCKR